MRTDASLTVETAQQYGAIGLTIGTISASCDVMTSMVAGDDSRGRCRRELTANR
jgi:hypothetical protein